MNELRRVDLNLLVVLGALLDEHHVSRAAASLGMSQPAVSHALGRLRDQLGDPLLVRSGRGLIATAFAERLRPQVHELLEAARELLLPAAFAPATAGETIEVSMSDYGAALLLPHVLHRVRAEAPGVVLRIAHGGRETAAADLTAGRIDLALGVYPFPIEDTKRETLLEEHFVCVGDSRRWSAAGFDLERYLAAAHLQVAIGHPRAEVDEALAAAGHSRRIVATVAQFTLAPDFVVGTDLLLTVASRMLDTADDRLVRLPLPFAIPAFPFDQDWHQRTDGAPAHVWVRGLFAEAAARLDTPDHAQAK